MHSKFLRNLSIIQMYWKHLLTFLVYLAIPVQQPQQQQQQQQQQLRFSSSSYGTSISSRNLAPTRHANLKEGENISVTSFDFNPNVLPYRSVGVTVSERPPSVQANYEIVGRKTIFLT